MTENKIDERIKELENKVLKLEELVAQLLNNDNIVFTRLLQLYDNELQLYEDNIKIIDLIPKGR
jgi:hypothetical protein